MKLYMTIKEIIRLYKEAKNKKQQIQILAELNLCSPNDIIEILSEWGNEKEVGNTTTSPKPARKRLQQSNVIISIRPKWCSLIFDGQKLVEIRKSAPLKKGPFICYVYQTVGRKKNKEYGDGMIVGQFQCRQVAKLKARDIELSCLSKAALEEYASQSKMRLEDLYAWRIEQPVKFQRPRSLDEFVCANTGSKFSRAPQSWSYALEMGSAPCSCSENEACPND